MELKQTWEFPGMILGVGMKQSPRNEDASEPPQ